MTPYAFGQKIARHIKRADDTTGATSNSGPQSQPAVTRLSGPQGFPKQPQPASPDTTPAPLYQHPSGSFQFGNLAFENGEDTKADNSTKINVPAAAQSQTISPGIHSGSNVFRVSQHGGGADLPNPNSAVRNERLGDYSIGNPNNAYLNISQRGNAFNPTQPLPSVSAPNFALEDRYTDAMNVQREGASLPPNFNPSTLISVACNKDPNGCTPATYARWINAERAINAGYPQQIIDYRNSSFAKKPVMPQSDHMLAQLFRKMFPGKPEAETPAPVPPTPPTLPPLNLNKVVMTPRGYLAAGANASTPTPLGSLSTPYLIDDTTNGRRGKQMSSAHEYQLLPGGDPTQAGSWHDTGVYSDARQARLPILPIFGEMKELGRHIGLGKELGGGGLGSYMDKVRTINDNPDATYRQKVQSNLARPVGSALQFGREMAGVTGDMAQAKSQIAAQNAKALGNSRAYRDFYGSGSKW